MKVITVSDRNLECSLILKDKYNIVIGDSGSGKTRIARLCAKAAMGGAKCRGFDGKVYGIVDGMPFPSKALMEETGNLFVVDEAPFIFLYGQQMAKLLLSDNYFILMCRDTLGCLVSDSCNFFTLTSAGKRISMRDLAQRSMTGEIGGRELLSRGPRRSF